MKLNNLAKLNQEFGQFQVPTRSGHAATMKMANAYIELEREVNNLTNQKKILQHSLEFARDNINNLESNNIVLTLKLNNSQAMVYTLVSVLIINFVGFGFLAWSLINMVR